jgi:hypothetical protein
MDTFVLLTLSTIGSMVVASMLAAKIKNVGTAFLLSFVAVTILVWTGFLLRFEVFTPTYEGGGASLWPVAALIFNIIAVVSAAVGVLLMRGKL